MEKLAWAGRRLPRPFSGIIEFLRNRAASVKVLSLIFVTKIDRVAGEISAAGRACRLRAEMDGASRYFGHGGGPAPG